MTYSRSKVTEKMTMEIRKWTFTYLACMTVFDILSQKSAKNETRTCAHRRLRETFKDEEKTKTMNKKWREQEGLSSVHTLWFKN